MRYLLQIASIALATIILTACTTDANRLVLEPVPQVDQVEMMQPTNPQIGPSTTGTIIIEPGEYQEDAACALVGTIYSDPRVECGPVIKTEDGKVFRPLPNRYSFSAGEFPRPVKITFQYVPAPVVEDGSASVACKTIQPVYLTCFTKYE